MFPPTSGHGLAAVLGACTSGANDTTTSSTAPHHDIIGAPEPNPDLLVEGPDDVQRWVHEWLGWFSWVQANPAEGVEALSHAVVPGSVFYEQTAASLKARRDEGTRLLGFAFVPVEVSGTFDEFFERREVFRLVVVAADTIPGYVVDAAGSVIDVHEPLGGEATIRCAAALGRGRRMDTREPRSRRIAVLVAVALAVTILPLLPAAAGHQRYFDPELGRLVCEDHGGGGGGGETTSYWTSWQMVGQCGAGGAVGGVLIDISSRRVLAIRDRIVDGEVVETQAECINLEESEEETWEEIASAIHALPAPRWNRTRIAR
jgi:hypothetical protein